MSETMPMEKHVLVCDWVSEDLDPERERLGRAGIALSSAGIAVTDSVDEKRCKLKQAIASASRIDALMFCIAPIDAEIIGLLPDSCKLLQRYGTGLDNVDLKAAAERGMSVRNTPQYCVEEVAVHAMGMLLALHRQLGSTQERLLCGEWSLRTPAPIRRLSRLRLGVLGFGRIGRKLGELMRPLVRDVVYFDEVEANGIDWAARIGREELLRTADLVSLHLPLTPQTRCIINAETLAMMNKSALLVNTARGALVDAEALAAALNEGRLGGAGLDVFEPEILPGDSPLRTAANILLTSHTAWYSEDSIQDARVEAVESVIEILGERK
ncbi:MAG: C-terminal binding protein [Gemmatimonadetes bacterium]|nr:C-terminal binding protein [Gemmatimonadota bacterium]MYB71921.1 C-terminal binding protein [Gemmatimonadota bacterium]